MITVLYLTDNTISHDIDSVVKRELLKSANGKSIVSVSQKPIDFGDNICVGEIGRSWMSLYKQLLAGLSRIKTEYVAIAEHDCLYSPDHFEFIPLNDDTFYYNKNHWFVQWGGNHPELNGMYSYWPKRHALSQLICRTELLKKSTEEVMNLLDMGLKVEKGLRWYGEPGLTSDQFKEYVRRAYISSTSGKSKQLQFYLNQYITKYNSEFFESKNPNLDIRHSSNFTGPKRGKNRCYELPYWGEFRLIIKAI